MRRPSWDDPAEFMNTVKQSYRKDWWTDQPERLLVISEKGTVGGILRPVLAEYGVGFLALHGFSSATAMNNLADLSVEDDRPLTLLYVGDHDPSGRYMSDVDIPERLNRYYGRANVVRLAVTPGQVDIYGLPTFSAHTKSKDARYRWFVEAHGETCCEPDALDPNILRDTVEGAIASFIDKALWERAETTEQAEMASLSDFLATWKETLSA
jgi:hypothetical protein